MLIDPLLLVDTHHLPLLEVHEVAYRLKCSHEKVRRLIRDGALPAIRLGRHWRVERADLKSFVEAQRAAITREERRVDVLLTQAASAAAKARA